MFLSTFSGSVHILDDDRKDSHVLTRMEDMGYGMVGWLEEEKEEEDGIGLPLPLLHIRSTRMYVLSCIPYMRDSSNRLLHS